MNYLNSPPSPKCDDRIAKTKKSITECDIKKASKNIYTIANLDASCSLTEQKHENPPPKNLIDLHRMRYNI